ncbi:hypothetical protein [uncultured Methylobacterium sp.]|uniref:hypothetical protein n=1 Tax=uncultured Methylobacterium sp. TaxID=157278 RepID=UPI0035CA1E62
MRMTTAAVLLCGVLGLSGAASAQSSTGAPAGRDPATAPGGTEGLAGPRNEADAIRNGDAIPVAPGRGGTEVDTAAPAADPVDRAPPPSRP